MEIGFEFVAAKPKGLRAAPDQPVQVPMRPREIAKNPSTDQKRVRRQMARQQRTAAEKGDLFRHEPHPCPVCHKECPFVSEHGDVLVYNCTAHGTFNVPRRGGSKEVHATRVLATQYDSTAERLNPGDNIRLPHGNTVKVRQVRNHETSQKHVYLDTDQGTTVVQRNDPFTIVPANYSQQELPGYGTPGGTEDNLPGQSSGASWGGQNYEQSKSAKCPMCGTLMSRHGQTFICPRDGFSQSSGNTNGSNFYSDNAPQTISRGASMHSEAAMDDVGDCRLCGGDLKHIGHEGSTAVAQCKDCGTEHLLQGKTDDSAHRISHLTQQVADYDERQWRHLAAIKVLAADWNKLDTAKCPNCGTVGNHKYRGGRASAEEGSWTRLGCRQCHGDFEVRNDTDKYASLRYASLRWEPQYDTSKYAPPQMSALARRAQAVLATPEGTL